MNRERIADGLEILFLQLSSGDSSLPPGWQVHEWAYIKGLASGAIWTIRSRFVTVGQS